MAKLIFKLNREGVRELLQGDEMQSILGQHAAQKAAQAGVGYTSNVTVHKRRAVGYVSPETKEAIQDNYENNTLLKVIGS